MGKSTRNSFAVSSTFRFFQHSHIIVLIIDETSLCLFTRDVKYFVCVLWNTSNSTDIHGCECASLRLFLFFSKPVNLDLPFSLNSCLPARDSLQYKTMSPSC